MAWGLAELLLIFCLGGVAASAIILSYTKGVGDWLARKARAASQSQHERHMAELARHRDAMVRHRDAMAEAFALAEYGAHKEAIELLREAGSKAKEGHRP